MKDCLTDAQWQQYEEQGMVALGRLLDDGQLREVQQRIDDVMLGRADVDYDRLLMQLDTTSGKYEDLSEQTKGHKGPSLDYRKIQDLEYDPLFLAFLQRPIFRQICTRVYGPETPVACFRAMFMNKPAGKGTWLPWHQDRWQHLDRDPLITVWTALDPATKANGCVQVIPGSHKLGLINPDHHSGFLTDGQTARHCPPEKVAYLELEPGEAILLHNALLHASDVNRSGVARRAFSVCYMDAATRSSNGEQYNRVFGPGSLACEMLSATA
jgi:phytanoyl-CoA hydroxylase